PKHQRIQESGGVSLLAGIDLIATSVIRRRLISVLLSVSARFGATAAPWRSAELLLHCRAVPVLASPVPVPPETQLLVLGSRAHSLRGCPRHTGRTGESYVPQQSDAHRFHRQ